MCVCISPCFLKVQIKPLSFYKRLTLLPVFINQKKYKEDFRRKSHDLINLGLRVRPFGLRKGFKGTLYFQIASEICICKSIENILKKAHCIVCYGYLLWRNMTGEQLKED